MFLHNCGLFDNSFLLNYQKKTNYLMYALLYMYLVKTASGGKNKSRVSQLIGSLLVDHAIFAD